jgi:hypothetical protein
MGCPHFWAASGKKMFVGTSNFSRIGVFKMGSPVEPHTLDGLTHSARLTSFENPPQKTVCMGATVISFRSRRAAPRPAEASASAAAWEVAAAAGGKEKR